jgi:hypothetical protein
MTPHISGNPFRVLFFRRLREMALRFERPAGRTEPRIRAMTREEKPGRGLV